MWDDTATSSPVPFPEKLSAEARKLGGREAREELGVCSQGKGLTCSVFPGEGKGRGGEGRPGVTLWLFSAILQTCTFFRLKEIIPDF